jgi:hypothetical protein
VKLRVAIAVIACMLGIAHAAPPLPARLSETGLYAQGVQTFSPQHPLWSDGATKRRWILLPPGAAVDASNVDAWEFPRGTKLWKEFGFDRPVETRMLERLPDGSWRFSTYVWNAEGTDAELAPGQGVRALPVAAAPNGRYAVPSRTDCLACHDGAPVPVLGFSALQLAAELRDWTARGVVRNLPPEVVQAPPRVSRALGYLHGNCGHCHNEAGAVAGIDLVFAQSAADPVASARRTSQSLFGRESRFREAGAAGAHRESVVTQRMKSESPYSRMPPLGVSVVDREGVALVEQWITLTRKEITQ